jgi:glycine/D-amino acid oxidase-like deaminating enzyme
MTGPAVDPVLSDTALPERADVVVVGGGIIGVSTAYFLAERGISVALCEKGHIAGEQSSRNWGWCRQMGRDPAEIPLSVESLRLWEGMNRRVEAETGYRRTGIIYVCDTRRDLEHYEAWIKQAQTYQIETRLLSAHETERVLPGAARRWVGAAYTVSDGRAEPQKATSAIADAARRLGAAILTQCAVRGIETQAGRISAAVTERGRILCGAVVLAGGAWSRLFCGNFGIELPQLKVLGSVLRTKPLEGPPEIAVGASDFAFRKRLDGGYTIAQRGATVAPIVPDTIRLLPDFLPSLWSARHEVRVRLNGRFVEEWRLARRWSMDEETPFERTRVLDPSPSQTILEEARVNLGRAFPAFHGMEVAQSWAGLIDVTPDAVPVISSVDSVPGFFIASGFSGHGFGIGPGAGRLTADLVTGNSPVVDPAPFRYERFRRTRLTRHPVERSYAATAQAQAEASDAASPHRFIAGQARGGLPPKPKTESRERTSASPEPPAPTHPGGRDARFAIGRGVES